MNDGRLVSVIVPLYNERESIAELYARVRETLDGRSVPFELILVDDGSTDGSLDLVRKLSAEDPRVRYASFSRNFGHEAASTCGMRMARGAAAVLMDADLQDPPELIPEMMEKWSEGFDVVYARRVRRGGEGAMKRLTAYLFYRVVNLLSRVSIPADVGDFRLVDRKAVDAFNQLTERSRFVRGLFHWIGFRQTAIEYDRPPRRLGETKYDWWKLFLLSLDAIFSFSLAPLRLCILCGFVVVVLSFLKAGHIVIQKLFLGLDIPGYALLTTGMFFLGGVQLLFLGTIGEYVGKIFVEAQGRPLYILRESSDG